MRVTQRLLRAGAAALALGLVGSFDWSGQSSTAPTTSAHTADIAVAPGRLLGATRFQLAWLDWDAPRPMSSPAQDILTKWGFLNSDLPTATSKAA
jgi:hypothetical protein